LNSTVEIVAHCKCGMRNARALELLMQAQFRKVRNLKVGILAEALRWTAQ
jgi:adenylyltransferase/sulfurtransferase